MLTPSDADMVERVATTTGALGYVSMSHTNGSVKVIGITGLKAGPGEDGLTLPLTLVTRNDATKPAADFVAFANSDAGKRAYQAVEGR